MYNKVKDKNKNNYKNNINNNNIINLNKISDNSNNDVLLAIQIIIPKTIKENHIWIKENKDQMLENESLLSFDNLYPKFAKGFMDYCYYPLDFQNTNN